MAAKYKLTYFNLKGLAEYIRYILSYMEEDFEDVRIEREEWATFKSSMPFGKLPMLEVEGKQITQSLAIMRYLGKKSGLAGKDEWESLQIDIIADTIVDARLPIREFMFDDLVSDEIKNKKKETYIKETLPSYLKKLDDVAKENGGYLANKKLSWVDIVFTTLSEFLSTATGEPDVTAQYPNLHAVIEHVNSLPQIKKWLAKRPHTSY